MLRKITIHVGSFIALLLALFVGLSPAYAQANTGEPSETLTVEEYETYLGQNSPETLAQFRALTDEQQGLFIRALQDPTLYTNEATDLPGVTTGVTILQVSILGVAGNRSLKGMSCFLCLLY